MKKKLLSLLLATTMLVGLVAGCGKTEAEAPAAETEKAEAVEAETEPVEVTWWNTSTGEWEFWEARVNEFHNTIGKEKNIKIVMEQQPEGADLEIAVKNGTAPDIFGIPSLALFVENGYITALNDLPGMEEFLKENDTYVEFSNGYLGKTYSIANAAQLYGLAYNKDMFVEAGIVDENGEAKAPTTWAEVVEYSKLLTDESKQQFGFIMPGAWGGWMDYEIGPTVQALQGFDYFNWPEEKYDWTGYETALQAMIDMRDAGSLYPGAESMDNDPARALFAEGKVGMKLCVSWDISVWNDQFPATCEWGVAPMPSANGEYEYYQKAGISWTPGVCSNNVEEKGEAIAEVFKFLFGTETQVAGYEQGYYFPYRKDIVGLAENVTDKAGWADFGAVANVSKYLGTSYKSSIPSDFSGRTATFFEKVWSGEMSVHEWALWITELWNEGMTTFNEQNPDVDQSYVMEYDKENKLK